VVLNAFNDNNNFSGKNIFKNPFSIFQRYAMFRKLGLNERLINLKIERYL